MQASFRVRCRGARALDPWDLAALRPPRRSPPGRCRWLLLRDLLGQVLAGAGRICHGLARPARGDIASPSPPVPQEARLVRGDVAGGGPVSKAPSRPGGSPKEGLGTRPSASGWREGRLLGWASWEAPDVSVCTEPADETAQLLLFGRFYFWSWFLLPSVNKLPLGRRKQACSLKVWAIPHLKPVIFGASCERSVIQRF